MLDWSLGAISSPKSSHVWNDFIKKGSKQKQLIVGTGSPWFSQFSVRWWRNTMLSEKRQLKFKHYATVGWKTCLFPSMPISIAVEEMAVNCLNAYWIACYAVISVDIVPLLGSRRLVPLLRQNSVAPWLNQSTAVLWRIHMCNIMHALRLRYRSDTISVSGPRDFCFRISGKNRLAPSLLPTLSDIPAGPWTHLVSRVSWWKTTAQHVISVEIFHDEKQDR